MTRQKRERAEYEGCGMAGGRGRCHLKRIPREVSLRRLHLSKESLEGRLLATRITEDEHMAEPASTTKSLRREQVPEQ